MPARQAGGHGGCGLSTWALEFDERSTAEEGLRETLCTLGNGAFATRGAAPEARADGTHYPATYAAGVYNRLATSIGGRTVENESLVNLPSWLPLTFRVEDGPWFEPGVLEVAEQRWELDLRRGILTRFLLVRDAAGRTTRVTQRRLVSMDDPHLAALETTLTAENWSGRLGVRSALDGRVTNAGVSRYRALSNQHLRPLRGGPVDDETVELEAETTQSRITVVVAARTRASAHGAPAAVTRVTLGEPAYAGHELELELAEGEAVTIEKVACIHTSRDAGISDCAHAARSGIRRAPGFDAIAERHVLAWDHLWRRFGFELDEGDRTRTIVNLHVFHTLQTLSPHTAELDAGVPARGLHGEAYHGHIFWDELFVFPVLNLRDARLSRNLLRYRYRRLPEARRAAREAGFAGAMFPWQSGSSGEEETQRLHLNPRSGHWNPDHSRLQRHVGSAVAYNVWQHYQVTGDLEFISSWGAELIFEIARFWASVAQYNRALDRYEIIGVVGPDEYHDGYPGADEHGLANNAYTNVMAVWVICRALELLDFLPADRCDELRERLALTREEIERWEEVSRKMRLVFHDDGVLSQFEGYADLEEFDWDGYRARYGDIARLDRILEAEGDSPNRYKLSKQADVLMLFYLLSADELRSILARLGYELPPDAIPRTVEYYLERTSHGSTLSGLVHAWVLARSDRGRSWEFFREALECDISDVQGGTTPEGIHLGAMTGSLDLLQRCFTGLEVRDDVLWFDPELPSELRSLGFDLLYRGHRLRLAFDARGVRVASGPSPAPPIAVGVGERVVGLEAGSAVELELGASSAVPQSG